MLGIRVDRLLASTAARVLLVGFRRRRTRRPPRPRSGPTRRYRRTRPSPLRLQPTSPDNGAAPVAAKDAAPATADRCDNPAAGRRRRRNKPSAGDTEPLRPPAPTPDSRHGPALLHRQRPRRASKPAGAPARLPTATASRARRAVRDTPQRRPRRTRSPPTGRADRRSIARTRQRQIRPHHRQQEGPAADRRVLFRPQLPAAVDHRRQGQRARHRGHRLSRPCRCRRPRSGRLSGAEFRRAAIRRRSPKPRSSSPTSVLTYAHHASDRPRALVARQPRHLLRQTAPEPADVLATMADAKRRRQRRSTATSRRRAGYLALKAEARRNPRRQARRRQRQPIAGGPVLKVGMQDDSRAGIARAARRARRRQHDLRQGARRRGEEIPAAAPANGDRHADRTRRSMRSTASRRRTMRPTSSSPTWNAGAGCRTSSPTPTSSSICRITRCG